MPGRIESVSVIPGVYVILSGIASSPFGRIPMAYDVSADVASVVAADVSADVAYVLLYATSLVTDVQRIILFEIAKYTRTEE